MRRAQDQHEEPAHPNDNGGYDDDDDDHVLEAAPNIPEPTGLNSR